MQFFKTRFVERKPYRLRKIQTLRHYREPPTVLRDKLHTTYMPRRIVTSPSVTSRSRRGPKHSVSKGRIGW